MSDLVACTGRHQQRYEDGCRLVAGYRDLNENSEIQSQKTVEVLMINSPSGPGLLFPKGAWDETVEEAAKREAMEEAGVRGELMIILDVPTVGGRLMLVDMAASETGTGTGSGE